MGSETEREQVSELRHTFEIRGFYDGIAVASAKGEVTLTGWPDAPPALIKAQTMAREFKGLAARWAMIEVDERARLDAR